MGSRDAGALKFVPRDPADLAGPLSLTWIPLSSLPRRIPLGLSGFLLQQVDHQLLGGPRWVWVDEGGVVHLDRPHRLGVVNRWWRWQPELPCPGKRWGALRPPPPKWG